MSTTNADSSPSADADEIRRWLELLYKPGEVRELRALDTTTATISGYFDDLDALTKAAGWANDPRREAPGVYITINPVDRALLARSANAIRTYFRNTTADVNIIRRVWFMVDIDSKRPAGISATDGEHEAALALALVLRDFLTGRGWPKPIYVDSGNGGYLFFAIDLANDDASRDLIKRVLAALAAHFDDDRVSIDTSVYNAARIARIAGTINRKGDCVGDRYHRPARILEVPGTIETVTSEQLADVAALLPEPEHTATEKASTGETFDLPRWIREHGIEVASESSYNGGARFILKHCPFDPAHGGTSAALFQLASGALGFKCQHNSCADNKWSDVRERFEPGYRKDSSHAETVEHKKKPPQADELVAIARDRGELFHDGDTAYVAMACGSHREVWALRSRGFKTWLAHQYFSLTKKSPNGEAIANALTTLEGFARFDAPEHVVFVRLAGHDDKIYLDLANDDWQAVEVDSGGWRIVEPSNCGVYFRRPRGMLALPVPEPQKDAKALTKFGEFLNVGANFPLVVSWPIAALRPKGPYPVLAFHGEQGSSKSTKQRYLRALVDPNQAPMRVAPKEVRDLQIAAHNSWVISFDNLSHISDWLSDGLCRLSTGGGFSSRELYTDSEETVLDATRPIVLNGIEELTTRADLLDRAMVVELESIPESARKLEHKLDAEFNAMRPAVLGALLNAVARALRDLPSVNLPSLPRMADFAAWVVAAESALPWKAGEFLALYRENIAEANSITLEASVIYPMLVVPFKGTSSELLTALKLKLEDPKKKPEGFPANARALSGALKRIAPNLRRMGINITWTKATDRSRARTLTIKQTDPESKGNFASEPSAAPDTDEKGKQSKENSPSNVGRKPDATDFEPRIFASAKKRREFNGNSVVSDGSDGSDANSGDFSGSSPSQDEDLEIDLLVAADAAKDEEDDIP